MKKGQKLNNAETQALNIPVVTSSFYDEEGWNALGEYEGEGRECCGKNMVELGVTYSCLKCGNWEYSSS